MSRYVTWNDVVGRYPDAAKHLESEGVGSYYVTQAEAEIDARLSPRYTTPFTPAPVLVQDLCIDLSYYKIIWRQEDAPKLWEYIKDRIAAVQSGGMVLPSTFAPAAGGMNMASATNTYRSAFGPDDATNWSPDQQALYDAAVSRR